MKRNDVREPGSVDRMFLFSRRDWDFISEEPVELAYHVFFQMWGTRQHPYQTIREGDYVFIGDPTTRTIAWETRVDKLLTNFPYRSVRHALSALRMAYGVYADDLNDYHRTRSGHGFLLAWSPRPTRRLDVRLPPGQSFGRNGYRELTAEDAAAIGLPTRRSRMPLARPPAWFEPSAATTGLPLHNKRYIPTGVRHEVAVRDEGRCVGCRTTVNLHYDHRTPFSIGGRSTVENLRLLCAASNLAKGARPDPPNLACVD